MIEPNCGKCFRNKERWTARSEHDSFREHACCRIVITPSDQGNIVISRMLRRKFGKDGEMTSHRVGRHKDALGRCGGSHRCEQLSGPARAELLGLLNHIRKLHEQIGQRIGNRRDIRLERQGVELRIELPRYRHGGGGDRDAVCVGIGDQGQKALQLHDGVPLKQQDTERGRF